MADYHEEILNCCKKLRLSSNLADRSAITEGESHQEYLYRLLKSEIDYRQNVRISKLINNAGFPRIYDFGQFRPDEVEFQVPMTGTEPSYSLITCLKLKMKK